ncbi:JAB domain-containing protein [Lactobacillus gigeriorum]|uniref:DNA repair protein RadC n=1 Tax=Lactobacillus gigeriorum DSM 23908 = CRBIP 24.85 TaxID=1423751 RepID=I7J300_9LACO|nr:DNA repair protein RadC [Lactobacillus gigeriorum]KRN14745.1 DNA repair protein RadC [Lactobacillus gigeriorum DSM 23908 = CRBIP 24.85]CCI87207.1 DNA repair protein RadC [Lactobacillus gigeriorum DSM 23908 = CRBIP 24.85]
MKKINHYNLSTDIELIGQVGFMLEQQGISSLDKLLQKLEDKNISSFEQLLNYVSGPECESKIAIAIEELMDRIRMSEPKRQTIFRSSREVGSYLANKLTGRKQEEFWAFYIDNGSHIVAEKMISKGTLDRSFAHPRDVFRWAVMYNCSGIIVVHNHPSGRLEPSPSDLKLTRDLKKAANLLKINLLDHFIVGKGQYFSMQENQMFDD